MPSRPGRGSRASPLPPVGEGLGYRVVRLRWLAPTAARGGPATTASSLPTAVEIFGHLYTSGGRRITAWCDRPRRVFFRGGCLKIHEYQAKEILRAHGVATPRGRVTDSAEEAERICAELGGRCVVKAQIHAGGRGKGGGVKLAKSAAEAREIAGRILGMLLVTPQTGPEGQLVRRVLVEEALDIARELYVSVTLDRHAGRPIVMASAAGGMDIAEGAARDPRGRLRHAR